jgi:hypothetical protein
MNRILMLLGIILACACYLQAADVQFAFDYAGTMPTGFELRLATTSGGAVVRTIDCGAAVGKTCIAPGITAGTYYATLYAYNISTPSSLGKEYSGASNEVSLVIAAIPPSPTSTRITGQATSAQMNFDVPKNMAATVKLTFEKRAQ